MSLLPESEKTLRAQIAAHKAWANTENRSDRTAPARAAMDAKFLAAANGDPIRAEHLRKAHFARLALKSASARRRSRDLAKEAENAEKELAELSEEPPLTPEAAGELALRMLQGSAV